MEISKFTNAIRKVLPLRACGAAEYGTLDEARLTFTADV